MGRLQPNGFSLVEVLISILLLALGVIGAAGMQLTALRTNQQSAFQTMAMQLASEMSDKMRANPGLMKLAEDENPFTKVDYQSIDGDPAPPAKLCYANQCAAGEMAGFDIYEWENRLKAALPGGRVRICRDATPWDEGAGALRWACSGGSDASLVIKLGWQAKNPDGSLARDAAGQFPPVLALTVQPYAP